MDLNFCLSCMMSKFVGANGQALGLPELLGVTYSVRHPATRIHGLLVSLFGILRSGLLTNSRQPSEVPEDLSRVRPGF